MRLKYVPIAGFPAAAPVINHSAGNSAQLRGSNEIRHHKSGSPCRKDMRKLLPAHLRHACSLIWHAMHHAPLPP